MPRLLCFSLCLMLLPGCGVRDAGVVRLGVAGPMSGEPSKLGLDVERGVELAVAAWNRTRGGVLGRRIELLVEDDRLDPDRAAEVAKRLVAAGVVAVIGHVNSSCSIRASEIYNDRGIVMITPSSTHPKLTERHYANVFRMCGRDDEQGLVAARWVGSHFPEARVAVVHDKTTYGLGLAEQFQKSLAAVSGKRLTAFVGIRREDQDYTAALLSLKDSGADLVYFGGTYAQAALLVKQARETQFPARWLSGDGSFDAEFVRIAGAEAAEGTLVTFPPDTTALPAAQAASAEYRKVYGEPGPYSLYAYAATTVLLEALTRAGTSDGTLLAETLRGLSLDTAVGPVAFDDKGDVKASRYVLWEVRGGRFVTVAEPAAE